MAKMREPKRERTPRNEQLDFSRVDARIAEQLSVALARRPGTMPDSWMGSFHPDVATVEQLGAAEWDGNMVVYAGTLRDMAHQASAVLAQVPDTAENRAAVYSARRALLSDADMYYDEVAKRPGAGLSATMHWLDQTTRFLGLAEQRGFSEANRRTIIANRLLAIDTELSTLLGFVRDGGWKHAGEQTRFCTMLETTGNDDQRQQVMQLWESAGGDTADFTAQWQRFAETVQRYHAQFLAETAPEQPPILGEAGVQAYLEKLGLAETPQEMIEWCKGEAKAIRSELDKIRSLHPEVTQSTQPADDAEILASAHSTRDRYIQHFLQSDLIPAGIDLTTVELVIRDAVTRNDLFFAAISPDGKVINCLPATAPEAWSNTWAMWPNIVAHELTHAVQSQSTQVDKGWSSLEASEGAAVAMEWLWLMTDQMTPTQIYQALQTELRRTVRMQLGLEYHRGTISLDELRNRSITEADLTTDFNKVNMVEQIQNNLFMNGAYWIGPRLLVALAKTEHRGNLRSAMKRLAHATGLNLPGHVLIRGANLDSFRLTDHLPKNPIPVQIAQRQLKATAS